MQRRKFIQSTALGTGLACLSPLELFAGINGEKYPELKKHSIMNAYLPDIRSFGLTRWRHLMPQLKKQKMWASPHAFGSWLKTSYITHIAAACGNVVTIEGVTCISDDIDYGDYRIVDGKIQVSDKPGFGMELLK